jgi:hypothetical protein
MYILHIDITLLLKVQTYFFPQKKSRRKRFTCIVTARKVALSSIQQYRIQMRLCSIYITGTKMSGPIGLILIAFIFHHQKLTWQKHIKTKRHQLNLKSTTNVMVLRTKIQTFSRKQDFNIQMHIKVDLDVWNSTMGMC